MEKNREEIDKLLSTLESGIKDLMESDKYKQYLDFVSKFYHYSYRNVLLILRQRPTASLVGSYTFWKSQGRQVLKGEKSLRIIAPIIKKVQQEDNISNRTNDTKIPEDEEISILSGFRVVPVFDISQTTGAEIPKIFEQLSGHLPVSDIIIQSIQLLSKSPITLKPFHCNGAFLPKTNEIIINNSLSPNQTAKTLIHEYTHSLYHANIKDYSRRRSYYEIQAESSAYVVAKHFGLDTSEYSFGYITSWSKGKSLEELKDVLKTVSTMANSIISSMEEQIEHIYEQELQKEENKIISELKKNKYLPTKNLITNISKLNYIMGKPNTLIDIKQYFKNPFLLSSEEETTLVKQIASELQSQELKRQPQIEL